MNLDPEQPYVIFSSFGNDSMALIQWAREAGLRNVHVAYSNTGWAAKWWGNRVEEGVNWLKQCGYKFSEIPSEGFKNMVRRKNGFPRQGFQFCTGELKILPAILWLDEIDPEKRYVVLIGVRREESENRKDFPEIVHNSHNHGGRMCIAPMVDYTAAQRDKLLENACWKVLPHRSMECFPCINSNKGDILLLAKDPERVQEIEDFEKEMGTTSKGKLRTMFRPYRHMGATGIIEIIEWAKSPRGKFRKGQASFDLDDGTDKPNEGGCLSGWCGI